MKATPHQWNTCEPDPVTLVIPQWIPPLLNQIRGRHWRAEHKAKQAAAHMIAYYAYSARLKLVTNEYRPVRRVETVLHNPSEIDPDAILKVLLDVLKRCRVIWDDKQQWCDWTRPVIVPNSGPLTVITVSNLRLAPPIPIEDDPAYRRLMKRLTRRLP